MKTSLYIIVDVSGSMKEMGKIHLQRNLCRYAAQMQIIDREKYADFDIHFYHWSQNISEFALQNDADIPALNAQGSSSLNALSNFLSHNLKNTEKSKILILSDGNFDSSDISNFQKQLKLISCPIIRTIAVGADADHLKLKKISTNGCVYLPENISSAIDNVIFGFDENIEAPKSTDQILQPELNPKGELG